MTEPCETILAVSLIFQLFSWHINLPGERIRCISGTFCVERNGLEPISIENEQVLLMIRPLAIILNAQEYYESGSSFYTAYPTFHTGDRTGQCRDK